MPLESISTFPHTKWVWSGSRCPDSPRHWRLSAWKPPASISSPQSWCEHEMTCEVCCPNNHGQPISFTIGQNPKHAVDIFNICVEKLQQLPEGYYTIFKYTLMFENNFIPIITKEWSMCASMHKWWLWASHPPAPASHYLTSCHWPYELQTVKSISDVARPSGEEVKNRQRSISQITRCLPWSL